MNRTIDTKQEAETVINILKAKNVPTRGFEYFTVGDRSLPHLLNLKQTILDLKSPSYPSNFLEKVIQGAFGAGKTNFIQYLQYLIERDASKNIVVSDISFRLLNRPDDFYSLIIQNMELVGNKRINNYQDILGYCYSTIAEKFDNKVNLDKNEIKDWFSILLYHLLSIAIDGIVNRDLLTILGLDSSRETAIESSIETAIKYLSKIKVGKARKDIKNTLKAISKNASPEEQEFVKQYRQIIDEYDKIDQSNSSSSFRLSDQCIRVFPNNLRLLEVIFKILDLAKINTVVLFIDELEALNSNQAIFRQTLERVTEFRDKYPTIGYSNLSFALICAATGGFLDDIEANNPALHSRWKNSIIQLEPFSASDIDNLIFKLRDLYFLAGKNLSPIGNPDGQDNHQLIDMRNSLLSEFSAPGDYLNARDIISKLIDKIESTWVI